METLRIWWDNELFRFYFLLISCLLLNRLPVIGPYFRLLATMVHEGGHVLMALLLGDKPQQVSLFQDTSGMATVSSSARWKNLLVSAAGYPLPALTALLGCWLIQHGYATALIWGVTLLTGLFLVGYIRNLFGILWSLSFLAIHIFLIYKHLDFWIQILAQIDTFTLLTEAIASTVTLVRIAWVSPEKAGDASNMARILHLPSLLFALLFFALNSWITYLCVLHFFPPFR